MNKRKLKKRCKRGGHYHFEKSIKVITKNKLIHHSVKIGTYGPVISWSKIGSCLTCDYCTDMMVDWSGTIYACYSTKINCGGCDNYMCKRYKLNPNTKFFKKEIVTAQSEPSDLKRYIEEQIKENKTVTARIARDKEELFNHQELFKDDSILEHIDDEQEFMKNRPGFNIDIADMLKGLNKEMEDWMKQQEVMKNISSVDISDILKALDTIKGSDTNEQ